MQQQKLCLKWNNHTINLLSVLETFQSKDILVDVTLSCEGRNIKAHKMVLSACSPYFQNIFLENPCQHPIVIINGMKFEDITAILNFMYKGEVNVSHEGLSSFLQAAEALKVKGLAEVCGEKKGSNSNSIETEPIEQSRPQRIDTPNKKRHRNRKRSFSDSNRSDDEGAPRKIKEVNSPEVHELSGDESFTGDMSSNGQQLNSLTPRNVYSRSHQSSSNITTEDMDDEYEVEPSKMLEQTLTENANNSTSSDNGLRIERIVGNASEMESSSLQEPESPPDIKPIIEYGESSTVPLDGNMMVYNEQSQPGPSNIQDGSLLHDNSHTQAVKIIPNNPPPPQPLKLGNILFPVTLPTLPQLFLINSGVWEQKSDIEIVQEQRLDTSQIKTEPKDESPELDTTTESSKHAVISIDTPLPDFSESIKLHLEQNDLSAVWGSFIDECARHYFNKFPNIQNSSEYQTIGRKMYAFYPSIAYDGKEPWSFFCKCLSQKIRHIKWKIKRKSLGLKTNPRRCKEHVSSFKMQSVRRKIDHRYTSSKLYKALLKELREGWNKTISEYRILEILRQTNKGRRTWLEQHPKRKMATLITEYPCFLNAKYIIEDFLYMVSHEDTSMMLERFESLFTAVGSVMKPPVENKDFLQNIKILKHLEEEISFEHGRRSSSKSILVHNVNILDEQKSTYVETAEDSFPLLYVFSNAEKIEKIVIAGDKTVIETDTTELFEGFIALIATYYTCGLEYPKSLSQILGLFQIYVVGDAYDGMKSSKFKMFMKTLSNYFDIGDRIS